MNKTLAAANKPDDRVFTLATRGEATTRYKELALASQLKVTQKTPKDLVPTASARKARLAAAARWQKDRKAAGVVAPPAPTTDLSLSAIPEGTRLVRRGEFDGLKGGYRCYTSSELLSYVYQIRDKELKWTEMQKLYDDKVIRVPVSAVKGVLVPKKGAAERVKALEEKGMPDMGAPVTVISKAQEAFGVSLAVNMALQRKPISPAEMMRWAAVTAEKNGTRTSPKDMRKWYALFIARCKQSTGIDLQTLKPQQLSKQRSGVLKSGVRAFTGIVNGLLTDEPDLKARGLPATGDWDELKLDLHKLLTAGDVLGPAGAPTYVEVDGERCEQITLLLGFMGYRSKDHNPLNKPVSLDEVMQLMREGKVEEGQVAGYPKLRTGFWDDEDFCVLPALLIFKGATGADPAWLDLVHDKTRLMVACTESGHINTELKYEWYRRCKQLEYCPFGRKPTIPQADSHASNESVEMSAEMELEDRAFLVAPPGHSTHLTQQLDHPKRLLGTKRVPNGAALCAARSDAPLQRDRFMRPCLPCPSALPTCTPHMRRAHTHSASRPTTQHVRTPPSPEHSTRAHAAPTRAPTRRTRPPRGARHTTPSRRSTRCPPCLGSAHSEMTSACRRARAAGAGAP